MYNNFSSVDVTLYIIIFHDFEIAGVIPIFMTADFEIAGVICIFMTADYQPISGITRRIDDVIYLNFRVTWEAPETCWWSIWFKVFQFNNFSIREKSNFVTQH